MRDELLITGVQRGGGDDTIYFDRLSSTLNRTQRDKLDKYLRNGPGGIRFHGYVSDDEHTGKPQQRTELATARATAVGSYLTERGWQGAAAFTEAPNKDAIIELRTVRKVILKPLENGDEPMEVAELDADQAAPDSFEVARVEALRQTGVAWAALERPQPAVVETARTLFGAEVDLVELMMEVRSMAAVLYRIREVGKPTDLPLMENGSEQPIPRYKYVLRGNSALANTAGYGSEAVMTFGPAMASDSDAERVSTFIHEAAHAAELIRADDRAYAKDRLFRYLPVRKAAENADHYRLLVEAIVNNQPPAIPDTDNYPTTMSRRRKADIGAALAYAETYLRFARQDVRRVFQTGWHMVHQGKQWKTAYDDVLRDIRGSFGRDLSAAMTKNDVTAFAGMFHRMDAVFDNVRHRLQILEAEDTSFDADNRRLYIGRGFAGRSDNGQVIELLEALVAGTPTVEAGEWDRYVDLIEAIARTQGNLR